MYENIRAARYSDDFYQASTRKREHILQWYIHFVHFMPLPYKSVYGMCIDSHAAISYSFSKGNTAQFPPNGLSTAPAAAARHLRCQNAR